MTRYAMIDLNSGYLFSVQDADTPLDAVDATDRETGSDPQTYEEVSVSQVGGRSGYAVYTVDDDYTCDDGQDQGAIDYVTGRAEPIAYLVRTHDSD